MTSTIIGFAVLLVIGYLIFRPRHRSGMHEEHSGQGEHVKDVSPHAGHGGKVAQSSRKTGGSKKTGGGCCG
ncbi:MAG: hypothetical protein ACC669_01420 [bacterium]